ncbi:MAG TPA: MarR family transcriptional regulator [Chthoniobacterales bacterium]
MSEQLEAQTTLEREFVAIFSDLADLFGNPPSLGAIYGLLFAAEQPLSMEDVVQRLGISKGSASQGLRQLEELDAITRCRENNGRSHVYTARLELKPLLSGFLRNRLVPRLTGSANRLRDLNDLLPRLSESGRASAELRLERITKWHDRASTLLPLAQEILEV